MLNYVNYRMRVTLLDGRAIVGRFMAFDRHMNLVLSDCEEWRLTPPKKVPFPPAACRSDLTRGWFGRYARPPAFATVVSHRDPSQTLATGAALVRALDLD